MPTRKISDLPITVLSGGEFVPVVKNGVTQRAIVSQPLSLALLSNLGMPMTHNGIPVVDSGSNSNGRWIRFADGTQLCAHEWQVNSSLVGVGIVQGITIYAWHLPWAFPASFASSPVVVAVGDSGGTTAPYSLTTVNPWEASATSATLTVETLVGTQRQFRFRALAIGRWY